MMWKWMEWNKEENGKAFHTVPRQSVESSWKAQLPAAVSVLKMTLDRICWSWTWRRSWQPARAQRGAARHGTARHGARVSWWQLTALRCEWVESCVLTAALNHHGRYNMRPDGVWHCLIAQTWMNRAHRFNCDSLYRLNFLTLIRSNHSLSPLLNFSQHFCGFSIGAALLGIYIHMYIWWSLSPTRPGRTTEKASKDARRVCASAVKRRTR